MDNSVYHKKINYGKNCNKMKNSKPDTYPSKTFYGGQT